MRKVFAIALLGAFIGLLAACNATELEPFIRIYDFTAHYSSDMGTQFTQDEILQHELNWIANNPDFDWSWMQDRTFWWWHEDEYATFSVEHTDDALLITLELTTPSTTLSDVIEHVSRYSVLLRPLYIADPAGAAITHWTVTIALDPSVELHDDFHIEFSPSTVTAELLLAMENARAQR